MMHFIELFLVQLLGSVVFGFYEHSSVVKLSPVTLSSHLENELPALVQFYAPWCHYCQDMWPIYIALADQLIEQKIEVFVGAVDGTEHTDLADKYSSEGFPTILFFRKGKNTEEYFGPPDFNQLYSFVLNLLTPSIHLLESEKEIENFISLNPTVVLGHFSEENNAIKQFYETMVSRIRSLDTQIIAFGDIQNRDLANKVGFKYPPGVILIRSHGNINKTYDFFNGAVTESLITKWVIKNAFDDLSTLLPFHFQSYSEMNIPFLILFTHSLDKYKHIPDFHDSKDLSMFWVDTNKNYLNPGITNSLFNKFLETITATKIGIRERAFVAIVETSRFFIEIAPDTKSLMHFVELWRTDSLDDSFPLQQLNENVALAENVQIITTSTFKSIVLLSQNDVFLLFYSPTCPHCQDIAPTWSRLRKSIKDDNVLIAQMDATTNDLPNNFNINGYPSMFYIQKYLTKGDKNGKISYKIFEYNGSRTLEALQKYIQGYLIDNQNEFENNQKNDKIKQSEENEADWVPLRELQDKFEDIIDAELIESNTDKGSTNLKKEL